MLNAGLVGLLLLWLLSPSGDDNVEICHRTGDGRVLEVGVADAAVAAHLRHGDFLPIAFHDDLDGDGFGDAYAETLACEAPAGTVANADDCDDSAAFVNPAAEDECGDTVDADCSGDDALCSIVTDGWAVTSGRVQPGPTPDTLIGSFTLTRLSPDAVATRGGGGCLLVDLFSADPVLSSFTCTSNADCAGVPRPTGGMVYCASPDGSGEPNRCWTRPGNYCSRSGFRTEGTYVAPATATFTATAANPTIPGSEIPLYVPVTAAGLGTGVPMRWMVLTCMAAASNPAGCAGGDRVHSHGPVFLWTPSE